MFAEAVAILLRLLQGLLRRFTLKLTGFAQAAPDEDGSVPDVYIACHVHYILDNTVGLFTELFFYVES